MIKFYKTIRSSGISPAGAILFILFSPVSYILTKIDDWRK